MEYKIFVGIDQSKLTIDVAMLHSGNPKELITEQFENNSKGFALLSKWIKKSSKSPMQEILLCSEHTGVYSYPLSIYCQEHGLALWMESAIQIKRSLGIQRGKNDRTDARRIAQYAFTHRHQLVLQKLPAKALMSLKQLLAYRERLVESKKSFQNAKGELKELRMDLSDGFVTKETDSLLKTISRKIKAVTATMLRLVREDEQLRKQYELITSVPGIGEIAAFHLLVYTAGFSRFDTWKQFACYCGIAPFDFTSGTSIKGKTRVSHLANKKLKSILTMCALGTIRRDIEMKNYYERRKKEGKHSMSILNVVRNKLVSRVFAVVQRGSPYISSEQYQRAA